MTSSLPITSSLASSDGYRGAAVAHALAARLRTHTSRPVNLMEVCGTHTVAIFRHGIRQLLPPNVNMLSGPGCPVCVTANGDLDKAIGLALVPGVTLCTFGDMLKVPGSFSSLQRARSQGADVRVVYSPLDALDLAGNHPERQVIFYGVGFETTAPTVAASIVEAQRRGLTNYSVASVHKVVPPALRVLLQASEVHIDGFLMPGHVSAVIGSQPYEFIPREFGIPCVVGGFEPLDILQALDMLMAQIAAQQARVEIAYTRAVRPQGNPAALKMMSQAFAPVDAAWRGIGVIPGSGLALRPDLAAYDALRRFPLDLPPPRENKSCRCGEVLRGVLRPPQCPLFGQACTPENPVGPCMVSFEGTCSAWYQYGGGEAVST
jgi:hydrogenase expression/formation protein HypD